MIAVIIAAWAMTPTGCKKEAASSTSGLPLEVGVVKVVQQDVPVFVDWVGTTDGFVNAVIRAQVNGYLLKRNYLEGAFVKKGEVLFEIDARKFKAALDQAKGELEKAKAQYVKSELDVKRDRPLAKGGAVSQKELDDSIQANLAAHASVASAQAALEQAELNLLFTKVIAPIDGIVGIAKAQIGDLVGSNDELASMSLLNPIRVYFPVSEQEYLRAADKVRKGYEEGLENQQPSLELVLSDGTVYPHKGSFLLVDRQVDAKTGTIRIAAAFPNPNNRLRPGQFARVRALTSTKEAALLVPQRAVMELQGSHQVAVIRADNTVEFRPVKVGERVGASWVIDQGLAAGEQVIAEGLQKLKAGMPVTPKPLPLEPAANKT
jgi:membrane fusion protein (multidrug efflux system)